MGGGQLNDKILIAVPGKEPTALIEKLKKKHPGIEITFFSPTPDEWSLTNYQQPPVEIFKDKTVIACFFTLPATPADAPNLDWVQFFSAGTNHVANHPIYKDTDITLTTCSGIHGPQIAEWVIGTALAHSHNLYSFYEAQKQRQWDESLRRYVVQDMAGQRLGVLGYGSIGRQVARVGKAMGMEVFAYTATPKDTKEKRADTGYIVPATGDPDGSIPSKWFSGLDKESLHGFLKQDIDVLVISLPLTDDTRHMISTPEFEILSRTKALVSNISRGAIIDQPTLISALEKGLIRGALLDVTDPEPLPEDDPLWKAPNVVITPHTSASSTVLMDRAFDVLELNLEKRANGEPLINVVNRKRGY